MLQATPFASRPEDEAKYDITTERAHMSQNQSKENDESERTERNQYCITNDAAGGIVVTFRCQTTFHRVLHESEMDSI